MAKSQQQSSKRKPSGTRGKNKKRPPHERAQTLSIPEAGRIYLGLGKAASYDAAERGQIPFIQISPKIRRVPIRAMERMLDSVEPTPTAA
jgi:hypothetical protein